MALVGRPNTGKSTLYSASNTISTLISNSMSTSTENTTPIENTSSTIIQNQEQVQVKLGIPTSQKELMDYFKDRMEK